MSALTLIQQAQQQQHQQQQQCKCHTVCVSELTAHRALILYNAYVVALLLTADVDSVLFVDQQQLTQYTHFSQTRVILVLLSVNVLFVQLVSH
jgi:hypothetical protein